ncbi:MAG: hypothetical protein QM711_16240 [Micropruina sp.]|uniref:hypothetical protein n=1 Tax=Micropruina sp. TaxID=2737536 RepID=UPI0039E29307
MSSSDFREPTNDQLWSQPPAHGPGGNPGAPMAGPVAGRHSSSQLPTPYAGGHHQAGLSAPQARPDRTVFVLAIVSLGVGVPLTAIGSGTAGLPGCWWSGSGSCW